MAKELKPCPLCENSNIDTDEMDLLGTGECCIHAICHKCGASAPVDKWNDRAELDGKMKAELIGFVKKAPVGGFPNMVEWRKKILAKLTKKEEV